MPFWLLVFTFVAAGSVGFLMLWLDSWLTKHDRQRRGWASARRQALEFEVHHRNHEEGGWN